MKYHSGTSNCDWYMAFIDGVTWELSNTETWYKLYSLDVDLDAQSNYEDGWGHCIPGDSLMEIFDSISELKQVFPINVLIRKAEGAACGITLLRGLVDRFQDDIIFLGLVGKIPESDPKWFEYQVQWSTSANKGLRRD